MREQTRPHDLVRLSPRAVARIARDAPAWVGTSLERAPWATVRRAHELEGIAIGIRGEDRAQRFAAVAVREEIEAIVVPEELANAVPPRRHGAFEALERVMTAARASELHAGPIGAAGYELATGVPALRESSDLDVLVRAEPSHEALPAFAGILAGLPIRIDVEVAFANDYGAALGEALGGGDLLVKTPGGPRILPPFSPAQAAVQALIAEAELTPKPALVDRRGSGAHDDLTLDLLLSSARTLGATFEAVDAAARGATVDGALRARLGAIGRDGEAAMLRATARINTHRGAIWTLGLLVAAHALTSSRDPGAIARCAARIAALPDEGRGALEGHGAHVRARFGVRGAIGEAQAGFPHVLERALPALREARARGAGEAVARVDALLAVMVTLDDTCLLHRGGDAALRVGQETAAMVLAEGGFGTRRGADAFARGEAALLCLHASPGGAADLLAAALFLDSVERGTWA